MRENTELVILDVDQFGYTVCKMQHYVLAVFLQVLPNLSYDPIHIGHAWFRIFIFENYKVSKQTLPIGSDFE